MQSHHRRFQLRHFFVLVQMAPQILRWSVFIAAIAV
jgi:hypothetical protein